jgi:pimeloyl-ACP methyl ester carboxylesterase
MTAATVAGEGLQELTSVILVDPTFIGPELQRDVRDSDVVDQHRRVLRLDKAAVIAELRDRHPNRSSEVVELLAAARLETRLSAFDVLTPPYPDYIPLARMFRMPVLLVVADAGVVSLETAQHLETVNPRIETSYVQHAGHGLPFDSPERLAAAVRPFLFERSS